ncbi:MAG: hypothetical protein NTZ20_03915 [Candidatus Levybacteria bacterium]|nr:hypothetical protein [Candidatus Levybacteria bacterium]
MALCSFTKTGLKSSIDIDSLYNKKMALLLSRRDASALNKAEQVILQKLKTAKYVDPRHLEVCFGLVKEAKIGIAIANKLEAMSEEEFMVSSYPYEWLDQLKRKTICRITNQDAIDAFKKIFMKEESI